MASPSSHPFLTPELPKGREAFPTTATARQPQNCSKASNSDEPLHVDSYCESLFPMMHNHVTPNNVAPSLRPKRVVGCRAREVSQVNRRTPASARLVGSYEASPSENDHHINNEEIDDGLSTESQEEDSFTAGMHLNRDADEEFVLRYPRTPRTSASCPKKALCPRYTASTPLESSLSCWDYPSND